MIIPPRYEMTSKIVRLLQSIEASKEVIDSIDVPLEIQNNIRRKSTLKSSLFSARIEGNDMTLEDLLRASSKSQKRREVFNILKALNWIYGRRFKDLMIKDILKMHEMVMETIINQQDLGQFRTEVGAIFNAAGIAIYLPPRPSQILPLMNKLVGFTNLPKEQFIPIKAALVHYIFEKIHPFIDGNGRVGRLLLQIVLQKDGYGMKGLLPIEEYLDNHRGEYYQSLEASERDVTDFVEFILEAISETAKAAKEEILKKKDAEVEDFLLPRRAEIFNIIKEHDLVSFDQIRRRFLAVNERTLRYDLKNLQDSGLIRKRGATKGAWYQIIKNSVTN